ncbi:hypothetical protein GCM10023347_27720 [Streptomyces chumphonensis]
MYGLRDVPTVEQAGVVVKGLAHAGPAAGVHGFVGYGGPASLCSAAGLEFGVDAVGGEDVDGVEEFAGVPQPFQFPSPCGPYLRGLAPG